MAFPAFQERLRQLFRRAKFDGGTVSRSTPVVEVVQTWNNPNETFTGLKINITDTASAADSALMSVQVAGAQKFAVTKTGIKSGTDSYGVKLDVISNFPGIWGNSAAPSLAWGIFFDSPSNSTALYLRGLNSVNLGINGANLLSVYASETKLASSQKFGWASTFSTTTFEVGFGKNSASIVEVNNGTAGTYRDLKLRNLIGTGNLATGAVAKSADYTATTSDGTIEVDASGAARTITLFACSANAGKILVIKKIDSSANAVTIDGNASETIDGATTISLASQYSTSILQVNAGGTGWNKLAGV